MTLREMSRQQGGEQKHLLKLNRVIWGMTLFKINGTDGTVPPIKGGCIWQSM